jgi:hypothetical protein
MLSIIDAASRITSASSQQLDILSKAYQAILLGDTSRPPIYSVSSSVSWAMIR